MIKRECKGRFEDEAAKRRLDECVCVHVEEHSE